MHNAEVVLHVRYDPKGDVISVAETPEGIKPQDWHNYLCEHLGIHALSGGRAAFYLTHEQLAQFKKMEGAKFESF
jgi:hypothetical protein